MLRSILIQLVLMFAGFASGSFAWASAFANDNQREFWWIGGMIGLSIGWMIAQCIVWNSHKEAPAPPSTPAPPPKQPPPKSPVRSEAITLLATLQREARFVDFVQESLVGYSDAQIGAVVRDVHRDCGAVLNRLFALRPAVEKDEGMDVEIVSGFDPHRWRLTGNVAGEPPFHGRLVHPGWEATICELPTWSGAAAAARIIAPAEVELK